MGNLIKFLQKNNRVVYGALCILLLIFFVTSHSSPEREILIEEQKSAVSDDIFGQNVAADDSRVIKRLRDLMVLPSKEVYVLNEMSSAYDPSMGQSQAILSALERKEEGFFVECGALDGETRSNTLYMERELGWKGILIEGDPLNFEKLVAKHRKAYAFNVCLSPFPHPTKVIFHQNKNIGKILQNGKPGYKKIEVECYPLYSILLAVGETEIDYFSLDVEGAEYKALSSIPWDKVCIKSLSVEYAHDEEGKNAIKEYMEGEGYETVQEVVADDNENNHLDLTFYSVLSRGRACRLVMARKWVDKRCVKHQKKSVMKDFFQNTTMHGLKYLGEEGIHPVQNFKFAALSDREIAWLANIMTDVGLAEKYESISRSLDSRLKAIDVGVQEILEMVGKVYSTCDQILVDCQWEGNPVGCRDLFIERITGDGLCCVFNSQLYAWVSNTTLKPLKTALSGNIAGVSVILDANLEDYAAANDEFDGFKVIATHPWNLPDPSRTTPFLLAPQKDVRYAVQLSDIFTNPAVQESGYEEDTLKCYFDFTVLKYIDIYSESSCWMECRLQAIIQHCNCRPFYFPVAKDVSTCGLSGYICATEALILAGSDISLESLVSGRCYQSEFFLQQEGNRKDLGWSFADAVLLGREKLSKKLVQAFLKQGELEESPDVCGCFPNCDDTFYLGLASYSAYPRSGFLASWLPDYLAAKKDIKYSNRTYLKSNLARLQVFYREPTVDKKQRDLKLEWKDFIASVGGLLGLACGFSVISGLEVCYYFFKLLVPKRRKKIVMPTCRPTVNHISK